MDNLSTFKLRGKLWLYPGKAAWHFLSIENPQYEVISTVFSDIKRGWGSLRVEATIGKTVWRTSIFPDKKTETYLLPIKKDVRVGESLKAGNTISFSINILD